jgi:Domain of unknown function (DUF397)
VADGREQGPRWVKSSLSYSNGACVEVADLPDGAVGVRHSMDPSGPLLRFTPAEWRAFLGGAQAGEFDSVGAASRLSTPPKSWDLAAI